VVVSHKKGELEMSRIVPLVVVAVAGGFFAQAAGITAPPQPTSGPGGKNYPFTVKVNGPYQVSGQTGSQYQYEIFTPLGKTPTDQDPNPLPTPTAAPVALFLQGSSGSGVKSYYGWLGHIAKMGITVVWANYNGSRDQTTYSTVAGQDFADALNRLKNSGPVAPLLDGNNKPVTAVVGHGTGAYTALAYAIQYSTLQVPLPHALLVVEPEQSKIPQYNFSLMDSRVFVMTVVGDQDSQTNRCLAVSLWNQLTGIASINKPFLVTQSDTHGSPQQVGNNVFPLTSTARDTIPPPSTVDDRDYNITYKLSVASVNCQIYGTYCDFAYGNGPVNSYGATTQTDMGLWSDDTPVRPLVLSSDPTRYFSDCQQ
jgi:hypothetical protein